MLSALVEEPKRSAVEIGISLLHVGKPYKRILIPISLYEDVMTVTEVEGRP